LNVIYLVTSSTTANIFGVHQIRALHAKGFQVHLVCGDGFLVNELKSITSSIYQIKYLNRNISLLSDFRSLLSIVKVFKKIKPKLVIYSTPKISLLSALIGTFYKTRIRIYQIIGVPWQNMTGINFYFYRFLDFATIYLSTHVTVVSASVAQLYRDKLRTIQFEVFGKGSHIGVNGNIFSPKINLPAKSSQQIIGFAGRLTPEKGLYDLLELFNRLCTVKPNLELEIIGDLDEIHPVSSSYLTEIKLNPKIKYHTGMSHPELAEHMKDWTVQVFLSQREGMGNVIIEAGACGIPTVCWNIVGVRDAIPPFMHQFLVPYNDMETLEKKTLEIINYPTNYFEKQILSSWYLENFEQKNLLLNFTNFIDRVIQKKNG